MTRTITLSAAAICLMTSTAFAGPTLMTDEQMESQVAGNSHILTIDTREGNVVWTVTNLDPLEGYNRGGKGMTEKAGPGLLKAVDAEGLVLTLDL